MEHSKGSQKPFALVMIDLDDFKVINDNYGHIAGDDVLRAYRNADQEKSEICRFLLSLRRRRS